MEKELPAKFAGLTGEKIVNETPKLEKRDKPDSKAANNNIQNQNKTALANNPNTTDKDEGKEDKGGILDRIKPRPNNNNNKTKRTKETTDGALEPSQNETGEPGEKPKRDPAKTRCTFWPSCKNTDCPFVHPSQQVS